MDPTPDAYVSDPPKRRRRTPQKPLPTRPTGDADAEMTLAEIGDELGLTRERTRQILVGALIKAEAILRRRGLTLRDFVDAVDRPRDGERCKSASS